MRPRNAAALRSEFGGLWIDHANARDLIAGRQQLGLIDSDEARLQAYEQLRQMLSWLRLPLVDPENSGY